MAVSLCFMPGLNEMAGTLGNLHWAMSLGAWIIVMQPPTHRLTGTDVVWVAAAALSGGETIVLLPLLAFRVWKDRANRSELLLIALILGLAILNTLRRVSAPVFIVQHPDALFLASWHAAANYFVYEPLIGTRLTQWLGAHANRNFYALWAVLGLVATAVVVVRRRVPTDAQLLLGIASWCGVFLLTCAVRPDALVDLGAAGADARRGSSIAMRSTSRSLRCSGGCGFCGRRIRVWRTVALSFLPR